MPDAFYDGDETPADVIRSKVEQDAHEVIGFLNERYPDLSWKVAQTVLRALLPLAHPRDMLEQVVVMHQGASAEPHSDGARGNLSAISREFTLASRRLMKRDTERTLSAIAGINRDFPSHRAVRESDAGGTHFILTLRR